MTTPMPETGGPARDGQRARGAAAPVADLTQRRIERALRGRARYRYVHPRVAREPQGYRIESPCCSRNVDPLGGLIDIAWLCRDADGLWRLHARDHANARWIEQGASHDLNALLDVLCADPARAFWP